MTDVSLNGIKTGGRIYELKEKTQIKDAQLAGLNNKTSELYIESQDNKKYVIVGDKLNLEGLKLNPNKSPNVEIKFVDDKTIKANFKGISIVSESSVGNIPESKKESSFGKISKYALSAVIGGAIGVGVYHYLIKNSDNNKVDNSLKPFIQKEIN